MNSKNTVLEWLLCQGSQGNFVKVENLSNWKSILSSQSMEWSKPIERAIVFGFKADRVAFAFLSGFRAALQYLIPSLTPSAFAAFCVTEKAGNSPKAINTKLETKSNKSGQYSLNGEKTFITGAGEADIIFTIAVSSIEESGKKIFKMVKLNSRETGVEIEPMDPLPIIPEIQHGKVRFNNVSVFEDDILPGDGYLDYAKPFRIIEEIHVTSAILGYLMRLAFEYGWIKKLIERMSSLLVTAERFSALDLKSEVSHIAFAGFFQTVDQLLVDLEPCWETVDDSVKAMWHRDRSILTIARKARDLRLNNAWKSFTLKSSSPT